LSRTPVTIFSDLTCPYSYVTEAALWPMADAGRIELRFRAYELHPGPDAAPAPSAEPGWQDDIAPLARALGLTLTAPSFRPRTAKAHEALRFARSHGGEIALRRAIFAAYWANGEDIGRIDVLARLAEGASLDPEALRIELDIDLHLEAVRNDRELASRLRVPGAPTLFVGEGRDARILVGAASLQTLDEALAGR
jgi:predicted DsbA family dithiol-disulfide isomerase